MRKIGCKLGIHDWRFSNEYEREGATIMSRGWFVTCENCGNTLRGDDWTDKQNHIRPFDKPNTTIEGKP